MRKYFLVLIILFVAIHAKAQSYFLDSKLTTNKTIGTNPYFGRSVAVSGDGNVMMVGATLDSGNRGTVFVYKRINGSWLEDTVLTPVGRFPYPVSSSTVNFGFGSDIALSYDGSTAIIGRAGDNNTGAIWVWERGVAGKWSNPSGRIGIPFFTGSAGFGAAFGASIDITNDGNTAVIGAPYFNNTNGAVYVMSRTSPTSWSVSDLPGGGGNYGSCVSISGNGKRIAIGGPVNGRMDYFDYGTSGWTYKGNFGYMPPPNNNYIGSALDLSFSGDTLAIGAINFGTYLPGAVTLAFNGSTWSQFGGDIKIANSASIGMCIKITDDGKTLAMGFPYEDLEEGGAAVCTLGTNGLWQAPTHLIGGPAIGKAHQGVDIAISANASVLVAGAFSDNSNKGAAYLSVAAEPVITTNSINGSPFCDITSYSSMVGFTTNIKGGMYNAELSDRNGSFLNATVIGNSTSSPISVTIPSSSSAGNQYRIRVNYTGNGNLNTTFNGKDNGLDLQVNTCPPAGISNIEKTSFAIFPNPAKERIQISNLKTEVEYFLFNATGILVQKGVVHPSSGTINVNQHPGMYFLQLSQKGRHLSTLKVDIE